MNEKLSWLGVLRLGLVQAALGAVVVLVISTLNRVMVVEYGLPAVLPGALVALHYIVQMLRPRFGHGSDKVGRRTPWILGGMACLALGGVLCAVATTLLPEHLYGGLALAALAYSLVGAGAGAAGTSLLVLLARRVDERRRAAAATIMWVLMIMGFAVTSGVAGHFLDPFSAGRLILVTSIAAGGALLVSTLAVWKVEGGAARPDVAEAGTARGGSTFKAALRRVWAEPEARGFTVFVFISMLAYSAQELLLEPYSGLVFKFTVGESTRLSGLWHGAVLIGMVAVGVLGSAASRGGARRFGSLRAWTIGGCVASAASLVCLGGAGLALSAGLLSMAVVALGLSNGVFAVSAIGSMMELATHGDPESAGVRMGLWGAAQAIAFAAGGIVGTSIIDLVRYASGSATAAFAFVFCVEATLFFAAARFAARIEPLNHRSSAANTTAVTA